MDRIVISGLRVLGVHGVLPEEQERAQPFAVDVELLLDTRAAGASDELADTVDYGTLCTRIADLVATERYALLERLADRIAQLCKEDSRVEAVVVEVRKLRPPVAAPVDTVGVRIER